MAADAPDSEGSPIGAEVASPPARKSRALSRMVAYSWSRQWPAEALMGISSGVIGLTAFCLQRSMGAPSWTSPWLIVLGQGLWVLAPIWPQLLSRMKRQATFTWIGLLSRGPLLLMAFASVVRVPGGNPDQGMGDWWILLATYLVSNNLDAVYTPHRNALIRANYPLAARGRIYGLVTVVSTVCAMVASQVVGHLMDHDPTWVRIVFPIAAAIGIAAHMMMARIRWRYDGPTTVMQGTGMDLVREATRKAGLSTWRTIAKDRDFRDFEIGFMLYGLGLLSASPLIVSHFAQNPSFGTADWAYADRFALPLTQLLLIWAVGRLSDRIGVVRVASISFVLLVPYFVGMGFVATPTQLIFANILLGVCMAGVNVSWALGPLHFAPRGEAHHYSAVHVACVGVRSILGPMLGWAVQTLLSFQVALIVSASLEALAGLAMHRLARRILPTS